MFHPGAARKTGGSEPGVDYRDAVGTATLGGARALGLGDTLGSFAVGKQFDGSSSRPRNAPHAPHA